ncbi:MAG TPA: SpoIIE family protein phosphatase [Planctomycetota bacterium]|nr:SpoIIE family protein phosphatase [Planctomycetota bacterium]
MPDPTPGETVVSSTQQERTKTRQIVADPGGPAISLSLGRKIALAMAAVTLLTAALVFVSVRSKSADLLDREIDARGARLVQTLASIEPSYWLQAMKGEGPAWRERAAALAGPEAGLLQMSVLDVAENGNVRAGVQIIDRPLTLRDALPRAPVGGVESSDGNLAEDVTGVSVPARSFRLEVAHEKGRLRFYVILSLVHIAAAQRELRSIILVPVGISVIAGVLVSAWIARRITRPVRELVGDIEQVSAGNLGHRTAAESGDEIGQLARAFNRMTEALQGAHHRELEARDTEHEMEIAAEIQANLAPRSLPVRPGVDIAAFSRPSKSIGGDYYDCFEVEGGRIAFIVADVAGKGVPGSLVMAMTRSLIRMEAGRDGSSSPGDTLKRVNRMLAPDVKKGMFVTALYCILSPETGEVLVASAGHHPLIVWRSRDDSMELSAPRGIALGLDAGPLFDRSLQEEGVHLAKGDRVVLFTDGAVESMDPRGEEFGDSRFQELCWRLATEPSDRFLARIVEALDVHRDGAPQNDDLTLVTFRYAP